jgi:hypothetical protein
MNLKKVYQIDLGFRIDSVDGRKLRNLLIVVINIQVPIPHKFISSKLNDFSLFLKYKNL